MIPMTVGEIAESISGIAPAELEALEVTGKVTHDSRAVEPGDLFVAIVGENHDGHDYALDALDSGAVAVIASHNIADNRCVRVSDTLVALADLANSVRNRLRKVTVVGITGSSGKTTTKDLLAPVLGAAGSVVAAAGSFNNEIGLPMTILQADHETKFLVLEMGARGIGHIARLCEIAEPDIGLVLNVGLAHVGEFGGIASIAAAKAELPRAVRSAAVLNVEDPFVAQMAERATVPIITYGYSETADIRITDMQLDDRARPSFEVTYKASSARVQMFISGAHNAINAAAVLATAVAAGVELETAATALSAAKVASRWRMETTDCPDGSLIINDAYNANPQSMVAGLEALKAMANGRETWAVLGEMRELGESSAGEHAQVGRFAAELGIAGVISVGKEAEPLLVSAFELNPDIHAVAAMDRDGALGLARENIPPGAAVLIKASRAIGLEILAEQLIRDRGGDVA